LKNTNEICHKGQSLEETGNPRIKFAGLCPAWSQKGFLKSKDLDLKEKRVMRNSPRRYE
jgi:hypothetical protein